MFTVSVCYFIQCFMYLLFFSGFLKVPVYLCKGKKSLAKHIHLPEKIILPKLIDSLNLMDSFEAHLLVSWQLSILWFHLRLVAHLDLNAKQLHLIYQLKSIALSFIDTTK